MRPPPKLINMGNGTPIEKQSKPYKLLLKHHLSPGDVLCMTSAVESLHRKYPGEYLTGVETTCMEIWGNNPRITKLNPHECHIVEMHYNAIHQCGSRMISFPAAFCEHLTDVLKRPVPLLVNRPQLYLSDYEIKNRLPGTEHLGPYVVLNAGYKLDYVAKWAGSWIWQQTVNALKDRVTFVQIGEAHHAHRHPPIEGAVYLVGKTTGRQLYQLVKHSVAALGPVTYLLHIAAALEKPYICTGGGREDPTWISYPTTQYLHTMGQLACCQSKGCWKSRVVPLKDGDRKDNSLCALPVIQPDGQTVPRCMQMIGECGVIDSLDRVLYGLGL